MLETSTVINVLPIALIVHINQFHLINPGFSSFFGCTAYSRYEEMVLSMWHSLLFMCPSVPSILLESQGLTCPYLSFRFKSSCSWKSKPLWLHQTADNVNVSCTHFISSCSKSLSYFLIFFSFSMPHSATGISLAHPSLTPPPHTPECIQVVILCLALIRESSQLSFEISSLSHVSTWGMVTTPYVLFFSAERTCRIWRKLLRTHTMRISALPVWLERRPWRERLRMEKLRRAMRGIVVLQTPVVCFFLLRLNLNISLPSQ